MKTRNLILGFTALIAISGSAMGAFYFLKVAPEAAENERHARRALKAASLTSKVEVFNMTLPCRREPDGSVPIAHADLVIEVPIRHRVQIEKNGSKLRDIISGVFRSTDLAALNTDTDLSGIKAEITRHARQRLDIPIVEILFLRFEYDVLEPKA
jgi:hypothetical protein